MPLPRPVRSLAPILVVAAAAYVLAVVAGLAIVASPGWSDAEVRVVVWAHAGANVVFDVVALTINTVFGPVGAPLVILITGAWLLLLTRSWRHTTRILIVLIVSWGIAETVKLIVQRPRPDAALLQPLIVPEPTTYSYPSGHTAFAAALACALVLGVSWPGRTRRIATAVGVVVVVTTAWSRVYLGVHYPTDVVAAALITVPGTVALTTLTSRIPPLA